MNADSNQSCDFDWSDWAASFPELKSFFRPESVEKIAERAALYFDPTKTGVVCCPNQRRIIFNVLVAHMVYLQKKAADNDQLAGPVSSVSQGSVSVSVDTGGLGKMDPWLAQSRYGQEFYALTKKYRSAVYIRPIPDPRLRIFP